MHTYEPLWDPSNVKYPKIAKFRFRTTLDVVAWAQADRLMGSKGGAEIWHLDHKAQFSCYSPGGTFDTLVGWASKPQRLYRSRADGLLTGHCPSRWLLIDSRPGWLVPHPEPTEDDVEAFIVLQQLLATIDVELVDAMVFDDACHWWSMRELATDDQSWPTQARAKPATCLA